MDERDPDTWCSGCGVCLHRHLSVLEQAPCGLVIYECIDCGVSPLDGYGHPLNLEVAQ